MANEEIMITEDYVSFETAKLLKEKGFDGECDCLYADGNILHARGGRCDWNKGETLFSDYKNECSAPTLQMTMKWLRERKQIFIHIQRCKFKFFFTIERMDEPSENEYSLGHFKEFERGTYEEAAEAAIKYYLEKSF